MLSQAKAVSTAAHLRGSLDLARVAEAQLYWVVGRNPFAQSTMYGEGYDYQQQYSAMSGDIVGSLPVGIKSRENFDVPYWPAHNYPNYKEVWVHPVTRWFALMADLSGPAIVEGEADGIVEFKENSGGTLIPVKPDLSTGRFRATIPEGSYSVKSSGVTRNIILLPASTVNLNLRQSVIPDIQVSAVMNKSSSTVTIEVKAIGKDIHRFRLLADNLVVGEPEKELNLDKGNTISWKVKVVDPETPWVAVIITDGNTKERRELFGLLNPKP